MVEESKEFIKNPKEQFFTKCIAIIIMCQDYSNMKVQEFNYLTVDRERIIVPKVDDKGKKVFSQALSSLPGTVKDVKDFKNLLRSFRFKEEDYSQYELFDPSIQDIDKVIKEASKTVQENEKQDQKTFVTFFYAGHGAMIENEQALLLNGVKKQNKDGTEKWEYMYPIEKKLRRTFANKGSSCFIWAVFDCCRSKLAHSLTKIDDQLEQKSKKASKTNQVLEVKRGEDCDSDEQASNYNFLFVSGCQANQTVLDQNDLVIAIEQSLRLSYSNNYLKFPACLVNLAQIFPGCVIQHSSQFDVLCPFKDYGFEKIGIKPDKIDCELEKIEDLALEITEDFDDSEDLEFLNKVKLEDGRIYSGLALNKIPNGFGRMKYKNFNKDLPNSKVKPEYYYFYEGNLKAGKLHGQGILKLKTKVYQIGNFQNDQFHGKGKAISAKSKIIGDFRNGALYGKATRKLSKTSEIQHGNFKDDKMVGACLQINLQRASSCFGQFKNHKRNGLCVYKYENGDVYCGQFKDDLQHGLGRLDYKSGDCYRGMYSNGERNGFGEFFSKQKKQTYRGFWLNDQMHGIAIFSYKDKTKEYDIYKNNECIRVYEKEQVQKVNEGDLQVPHMDVFKEMNYLKEYENLNFDFIKNKGRMVLFLINDIKSLAQKKGMFDHELDEQLIKDLDHLDKELEELDEKFNKLNDKIKS